jgi:hypothetical protein
VEDPGWILVQNKKAPRAIKSIAHKGSRYEYGGRRRASMPVLKADTKIPYVFRSDETWVDSIDGLQGFLEHLPQLNPRCREVFVYCRGKFKKLSVLQIFLAPLDNTWFFHVQTLQRGLFDTKGPKGQSIRGLLERYYGLVQR